MGVTPANIQTASSVGSGDFILLTQPISGGYQTRKASVANIVGGGGSGGTSATLDAVIRAEPSLTHYWPMTDAPGSSSAVDVIGGVNASATSGYAFGCAGVIPNGMTSFRSSGGGSDGLVIPSAAQPSPSSPFTVEFIVAMNSVAGNSNVWFSMDGSGNFDVYTNNGSQLVFNAPSGNVHSLNTPMPSFRAVHMMFIYNGTYTVYLNGLYCGTAGSAPSSWSGNGAVGHYGGAPGDGTPMRFGYLAYYNAALTDGDAEAHFAATQIF